jgi:hypothetical protein
MTRICAWCGTSFTAPTSRALYCCGAHRAAASKARAAGLPGSSPTIAVGPITTHVGAVRTDLAAWLAVRGTEAHPLASAALALADRLDTGQDTSSAMASAVGRLQAVMLELQGDAPPRIDRIDLIRLRAVAKRAGVEGLDEVLNMDAITRIWEYEQSQGVR